MMNEIELKDMYKDCLKKQKVVGCIIALYQDLEEESTRYVLVELEKEESIKRYLPTKGKIAVNPSEDKGTPLWFLMDLENGKDLIFRRKDQEPFIDNIQLEDYLNIKE